MYNATVPHLLSLVTGQICLLLTKIGAYKDIPIVFIGHSLGGIVIKQVRIPASPILAIYGLLVLTYV